MFKLNKISLTNFRRYKEMRIEFQNDKKVIFVGQNASGKTSIVEAIYYLAFGKSFKSSKDDEIIAQGADCLYVKGNYSDGGSVAIGIENGKKYVFKDEKKIPSFTKLIGYFLVVAFCPDDLLIIKGDPKARRRFIDSNLCQVDKSYLSSLSKVKKLTKERNEYLKFVDGNVNNVNYEYLDTLTSELINASCEVVTKRKAFINILNDITNTIDEKISGGNDNLEIKYAPNVGVDNFWITYQENKMHDIYAKTTTWGPHRDDLEIKINNKTASASASQGQVRSACLALKLGVVEFFKNVKPNIIIILDDVFSELDENRQNEILDYLDGDSQVFITTTNINLLSKKALDNSEIIEIRRDE